jgi:hypothetical protein
MLALEPHGRASGLRDLEVCRMVFDVVFSGRVTT